MRPMQYQRWRSQMALCYPCREELVESDEIGTVGTAEGAYLAHLHCEVRLGPYVNPGQGYADTPLNRVAPERFIRTHRGTRLELLNRMPKND